MKTILLFLLCAVFAARGQEVQTNEVKNVIQTFFEGFHKGDTVLLKTTMSDTVIFQTALKNQEQKDILQQTDISNFIKVIGSKRPVSEKWEERILSYTIKVDGNMANAWTTYEFWHNGVFSHCGVNSFQLFNDNNRWKIIYLIDTRRKEDCNTAK